MGSLWTRFCAWRADAAARSIQRHVASGNRRRELRAWRRCGFWTRLMQLDRFELALAHPPVPDTDRMQ